MLRGRILRLALGVLIPGLLTGIAAALGYAFALYPMWYRVAEVRRFESLGGFLPSPESRRAALGAYLPDSGLDLQGFDRVLWAPATVMTPFVGYGPAPGPQYNGNITGGQFRGSRDPEMPKPNGVTRIILTGASVAFSAGAPSEARTVGSYLQEALDSRAGKTGRRVEVLTFAAPAWSSTHERIAIENRLSDLEPDVVVSLTGVADALYGELGHNVLWSRALTDQYYWELVNITLKRIRLPPMADVQEAITGVVPPELVAVRLKKNVVLAAAALQLAHARYRVFLQPAVTTTAKSLGALEKSWRYRQTGYFRDAEYYKRCWAEIDRALSSGGLPPNTTYANLSGVFDSLPETTEVFLDSYHFGDRGNSILAGRIAAALLETELAAWR
jgi:hypothetical protein